MTRIYCNAELKIHNKVLRCKFRGQDSCCIREEMNIRDEENAYAVCGDVDWIEEKEE